MFSHTRNLHRMFTYGLALLMLNGCGGVDQETQQTEEPFVSRESDFDSFAEMVNTCGTTTDGGWCREEEGVYKFLAASSIPEGTSGIGITSSSSGSSSGSISASSSSSGATASSSSGGYTAPVFAHAPSVDWVTNAGWEFAPGSYQPNVSGTALRIENVYDGASETAAFGSIRVPVAPSERGYVYRISGEARSANGALVGLTLKLSDNILVLTSPTTATTRDIAYLVDSATLDNEWAEFGGEFEFWSSSALNVYIGSDAGEFNYRNLRLELVGKGVLSDNPILDSPSSTNNTRPSLTWYTESGWVLQDSSTYQPELMYYPAQLNETLLPDQTLTGEHGPFEDMHLYAVYQERGETYLASTYVRSADGAPIDVHFGFLDDPSVASNTGNYDIASMSYHIGSATVSGDEWQMISGSYVHEGSSGFRVRIYSDDGAFMFRDLSIDAVDSDMGSAQWTNENCTFGNHPAGSCSYRVDNAGSPAKVCGCSGDTCGCATVPNEADDNLTWHRTYCSYTSPYQPCSWQSPTELGGCSNNQCGSQIMDSGSDAF